MDNCMVRLENLTYAYDEKKQNAISHLSLAIPKGSFTTLLGPSGCGKTTLLRLLAGFLSPKEGKIFINGVDQSAIEPEKRGIGMVFQDYALFPHMRVGDNILYGLTIQKIFPKEERKERVVDIAKKLGLDAYLARYPHELSGGQQQRVALARALVLNPEVLLMDEPLSSLDTALQKRVRKELKEIQEQFGITTIYVTHNQEEALYLSDDIAVLHDGVLQQFASPQNVYFQPSNRFVATFIGGSNFLKEKEREILVRPEWLIQDEAHPDLKGTIQKVAFLGEKTQVELVLEEQQHITMTTLTEPNQPFKKGETIGLRIRYRWGVV